MQKDNRWLLPEGVDELLPQQAHCLEFWRRQLLDVFQSWGYEYVIPPLVEYLDSLFTGVGNDLADDTFKFVDPSSGQLLGIRADMTPQVARIEANRLQHNKPVRLCYIGSVLHSRLTHTSKTRSPIQVGAELYGHAGIESDFEILSLMLECLSTLGLEDIYLDMGHVGVYLALAQHAKLNEKNKKSLFDALQRKAMPEITDRIKEWGLDARMGQAFKIMTELNGDRSVLAAAEKHLSPINRAIDRAVQELIQLSKLVNQQLPQYSLNYDLAELRGYSYHTGIVFAAFVKGNGQEVAKGGRYDNIGKEFGRGRPATGFSSDLKMLSTLIADVVPPAKGIFVPYIEAENLMPKIKQLRAQGEIVICELPKQSASGKQMNCDRVLKKIKGDWVVEPIEN